jgi:hypothetical protein
MITSAESAIQDVALENESRFQRFQFDLRDRGALPHADDECRAFGAWKGHSTEIAFSAERFRQDVIRHRLGVVAL